ncbi:hypothetical protein Ahia01_001399600 [Argonauta hians]
MLSSTKEYRDYQHLIPVANRIIMADRNLTSNRTIIITTNNQPTLMTNNELCSSNILALAANQYSESKVENIYCALLYHTDDEDLAIEIKEHISKLVECELFDLIATEKSNSFDHIKHISEKQQKIVLLITENFLNDDTTDQLRSELVIYARKKLILIKYKAEVPFSLLSYRCIDWDKETLRNEKLKSFFPCDLKRCNQADNIHTNVNIENVVYVQGANSVINLPGAPERHTYLEADDDVDDSKQ